jgi:hypothetical protein
LGHTIIYKQIRKEENKKNQKKIENFEKKRNKYTSGGTVNNAQKITKD